MNEIILENSKLEGEIFIPPSKSVLHRYIISASLADGISKIDEVGSLSEDIIATINCMKNLGADIVLKNNSLLIDGRKTFKKLNLNIFNCNESGSTLRFLIPVAMVKYKEITFTGKKSLFKRPLEIYYQNFIKKRIKYSIEENKLIIFDKLIVGSYEVEGNISSQFVTGLLFALPLLKNDSEIIVKGKLESKFYVDLTIDCLKNFGINIKNENYKKFFVKGNQKYRPYIIKMEGDFSQAAFFIVANFLGANINIKNLNFNSLQGDKIISALLNEIDNANPNKKIIFDGSDFPDIVPILSLAICYKGINAKIINIERLKFKESDRLFATAYVLRKLSYNVKINNDSIEFYPKNEEKNKMNIELYSFNDHRIAMLIGIATLIYPYKIKLIGYDCVKKSYPNFWSDFVSLGGKINEYLG